MKGHFCWTCTKPVTHDRYSHLKSAGHLQNITSKAICTSAATHVLASASCMHKS